MNSNLTPETHSKRHFDLGSLDWALSGFWPTAWKGKSMELGFAFETEIPPIPVQVPGSVQKALRTAGVLPDWNEGLNARACEWVEHREWMFSAELPDDWFKSGRRFILNCGGLDGNGVVIFNRKEVGRFANTFIPYQFDLTEHIQATGNRLHLVFFVPPPWLGQIGYTSEMKEWKPRFNYGWDWISRVVQIGPWEPVSLVVVDEAEIKSFRCRTDWDVEGESGSLFLKGVLEGSADQNHVVRLTLSDKDKTLKTVALSPQEFAAGVEWRGLPVAAWWPNGEGDRQLYSVRCELLDAQGVCLDVEERRVGFKNVVWKSCLNSPEGSDPWICVVNGRPVFLQGVNWTPILPNFADVTQEQYVKMTELYASLGCNTFRVWGGACLEKTCFYDLCDELGILVWQEFSLCSSGHENWPHEDEPSIQVLVQVAASYIERRQHHASLLMWCGGNELQGSNDGGKVGVGKPVGLDHPLMKRWLALVEQEDPGRRFVPTSASGPRFLADPKDYGKGLHWDVHGPWTPPGATPEEWAQYWDHDDALFRSEAGSASASSADLIRQYAGDLAVMPANRDNPLWRRFSWWIAWDDFIRERGSEPSSLEDYVTWSQARQASSLVLAVETTKKRFPGIGGIILWMGHDAFPCTANTSIIEFNGQPKPAALALSKVWKSLPASL